MPNSATSTHSAPGTAAAQKTLRIPYRERRTRVNVTNHRVLLDNSITIGGFHYNDPRMIAVEARYRFKF